MFKKGLSMLLGLVLLMGISTSAFAQTGGSGGCGTTVWNDAYSYGTGATTVDWKASKGSTCGTVYYKMRILQVGDGTADIGYQTSGSFSSSTPIKSVYISDIKNRTPYPGAGAETYKIEVKMYYNSTFTQYVGVAYSANFIIY